MDKNLLSTNVLVQTPIIKVKIGDYEFGNYNKNKNGYIKFPNYIQRLDIVKVNGQVNKYTLVLSYQITERDDPNYFEKVFSSVAQSRIISFTYGDASFPSFEYKNEEAIIQSVKSSFQKEGSSITYTVSAVSKGALGLSGSYTFKARRDKPSTVILELLQNSYYGLQDLFTGMRNLQKVYDYNLIPRNDQIVNIYAKSQISLLDYLQYLVSCMIVSTNNNNSIFAFTINDDTTDGLNGTYFKIIEIDSKQNHPEAYNLDVGYPDPKTAVFDFQIENDENYSIYYDYQNKLHPQEYAWRINADGEYEEVYAPIISSNNTLYQTTEEDKRWWDKVTQYPIKASLSIKGLLRPAILMTYVNLNVLMYGRKHISSGLYIITKQTDTIDGNGYNTQLNLLKIAGD